jgi:hypothetical protein
VIGPGACVVAYLGTPREQIFGVVVALEVSGITMRGITLESVDDWLRELARDRGGGQTTFGLSLTFYPMHRVEKIVIDETAHGSESIRERFQRRTGIAFEEHVAGL